jgi:regulatory protein
MPQISRIVEQKRSPNRRSIYLDGKFAFGCNVNVVARFRLREGMALDEQQIRAIRLGEVKQEAMDAALKLLSMRLHSRAELLRKLKRREYGDEVLEAVMEDLTRLGYLNDARFAQAKSLSLAQHKKHGRRRALQELRKAGVTTEVAERALGKVYDTHDTLAVARELAAKQASRLKRLDPLVARRRLIGMLQRRGFDYDDIKPVVDEVLGNEREH